MLRIDRLKKTFGVRTLFEDVTYHFPEGERVALVGANGAGKTTLLNILCGLDTPDDGTVTAPANVTVGYLPQKPNPNPAPTVLEECASGAAAAFTLKIQMDDAFAAMESDESGRAALRYAEAEAAFRLVGGYALEARAAAILRGLGFSQEELSKNPAALSGGWRMRLELARLFIRSPDFLVLDEPTNHLDLPSLVWVESYLQAFRGTLLFVSHDRALLNRLATLTLHMASGRLTPYRGNFDAFLEARENRVAQEQAERDQLRRRREQMEKFVERFGAKATKAAQAQSRVKMIARIRDVEDSMAPDAAEDSVFIDIPEPAKTPRIVFQIDDGAIGYGAPLARGVMLTLERGAKVAIIGANGIGKSTLLRTIAGRLAPLKGTFTLASGASISYFAQDQTETLDSGGTVLANVLARSELSEKQARTLLGSFLFRGEDAFKRVSVLSGGEQSRVGLACALARRASLLLLDEPTNHLDMASVETLAGSLDAFSGTVLFVSHDRSFIDAICSHVFAMLPDGRSMLFEGKLADYSRLAELAGFPNVLSPLPVQAAEAVVAKPAAAGTALAHQEVKELKRQRQKLASQIQALDTEMARLRGQVTLLEGRMAELGATDFTKAAALHAEQTGLQARIETAEHEWLTRSEELELLVGRLAEAGRD